MADDADFVRSQIPGDEAAVIVEIDALTRRLRRLKRAVQGKNPGDDPDGPPDIHHSSGLLDTSRLGREVVRLFLDLQRLHYLTADVPSTHLSCFAKRDGEWRYFRAGAPAEAGWRAVDGDGRREVPGEEA